MSGFLLENRHHGRREQRSVLSLVLGFGYHCCLQLKLESEHILHLIAIISSMFSAVCSLLFVSPFSSFLSSC